MRSMIDGSLALSMCVDHVTPKAVVLMLLLMFFLDITLFDSASIFILTLRLYFCSQ